MTEAEFAEARKFWLMFQANKTFKAVHQGCLELISSGLKETSPLYFPLIAGLICLYGNPFKGRKGLGKQDRLPIKMVPEEHLDLHNEFILIRDKLYAHSEATITVIQGKLHFGELRCYKCLPDEGGYFIDHLHIAPEFFTNSMSKLTESMMEKTQYYIDRLSKKLVPHLPSLQFGEFLLNIKDKDGAVFTQVEPIRGPSSDAT